MVMRASRAFNFVAGLLQGLRERDATILSPAFDLGFKSDIDKLAGPVTQLSHLRVKSISGSLESAVGPARPILTNWISALKLDWLQDKLGGSARIKGLSGAIISVAIGTGAIFALTHALKNVDYSQVFEIIRATDFSVIAMALMLVTASYGSITLYDWLALHTMGRKDVPYRIAALASLTSYPIAHGIGAVALVSPVIRYRIFSGNGLGALGVANICFLTGLTFWLGNMTALGFSLLYEPTAISVIDRLSPGVNRAMALVLLCSVGAFLAWSWFFPRSIGKSRW